MWGIKGGGGREAHIIRIPCGLWEQNYVTAKGGKGGYGLLGLTMGGEQISYIKKHQNHMEQSEEAIGCSGCYSQCQGRGSGT